MQSAEFEDKDLASHFHGATDVQSKPLCPMEADHDSGAAALDDGLRGYVSSMLGKRRDYTDGCGLCSPGRWQPSMRRCADDTPSLAFAKALGVELLKLLNSKLNIRELMFKLAAGKVTACPLDAELIEDGRELIFKALEYVGTQLPVRVQPDGQPFFLAAIEELLRISGDPDFSAFFSGPDSFAKKCGLTMLLASRMLTKKVVCWCDLCAFSIFPPSTTLENGGVIVRLDLASVPVLKGTRASPLLVVLVDLDLRSGHLATILQNM